MSFTRALVEQFHHPRGLPGRFAGWIMATRGSNLARNRWTVDLLDPEPSDHVLELGPGPGVTLGLLLQRVPSGHVTGLDHSTTMLAACANANAIAIADQRLSLVEGSFINLPQLPDPFDRILAVNSLQFDAMNPQALRHIVALLKPGGRLAITFQPRGRQSSDEQAREFGNKVACLMRKAGLQQLRIEQLPLQPVCAICVLGSRSSGGGSS